MQTKNWQIQNRTKTLCSITYKAAFSVESIDEGRIGIVLFVDLETQVGVENIVEEWHLIPVYGQADNNHHVM